MPDHPVEVVVLLGTSFARLEGQGTRWRFVLREWAQDPRVRRLVAVDFPKLSPRHLAGSELAVRRASWLEGCELLEARVPVHRRSALGAGLAWRRTGRAVSDLLGPARTTRLVLATTPLSAPLLAELPSDQVGFDAVDDWRELPGVAHLRTHVARGYRCLPAGATSTSVSSGLAETLRRYFSLTPVAVPNGVDLAPYGSAQAAPGGLPRAPFAVYVGVVQERFDFDLLDAVVAAGVPVVVAGPASGVAARRLESSGATWLGRVDVQLVPGLLQRAAVGLVPHVVDPLTMSMDPMKVLEYLAAGLPVVTTPVARSVSSDRVTEASGADFVAAAQAGLARGRYGEGDDAVAERDWSRVARKILEVHAP